MRRAVPESDILKPVEPTSFNNSDEWPQFILSHASIISNDTGTPVSLLVANDASPLTVTGRLERIDHAENHYLRERNSLPATVELNNVQHFSYGQFDSGEFAFWAAGESGWFEIRPARQYRAIYRDMVEAIGILYFVADIYRDVKGVKKRKQITVDFVLSQYANDAEFSCPDAEHARTIFLKHRLVLFGLMHQGKEGIPWKSTALFHYLQIDPSDGDSDLAESSTEKTANEESEDENLPARLAGKGKSSLRPKSFKHSSKGSGRNGQGSDTNMPDAPRESSPLKRKSTAESAHTPPSKRPQIDGPCDDGEEIEQPRASLKLAAGAPSIPTAPLPLQDKKETAAYRPAQKKHHPSTNPPPKGPVLDVVSEPMPSFEPTGPGDTWTCGFDGCNHKVYGASTPESRELIKEHYRQHAHDSQAQIDLVYKEERPYLPVGNLVKKIREMAAQQKVAKPTAEAVEPWRVGPGGTVLEAQWPKPVKQKY